MTFTELLTEVYNITSRPDLVDLTKSAVKAATLKAHQLDFFSRDIFETPLKFTSSSYLHSIDIYNIIGNYRALKYLRQFNSTDDAPSKVFTIITPDEILDEWNRERTDVAYAAGRNIQVKSSTLLDGALFGCYVTPIVVEEKYSSWVAELYPYAIIHEAARVVFGTTAQDAEKQSQASFVAEQYAELKINALPDVGS